MNSLARPGEGEDEAEELDATHRFLTRVIEDRARGLDLGAEHYSELFPSIRRLVARELELARGQPNEPPKPDGARHIGAYRVLHELGRGSQARVVLALHEPSERRVVLKLLATGTGLDCRARLRLEREARLLARIEHPGVCRIEHFGDHPLEPYLALEFVAGRDLARILDDARTCPERPRERWIAPRTWEAEREFAAFFEGLALALQALHDGGVLHRDLKPANIVLRDDGRPVVVDLGLGSAADGDEHDLTRTGELLGTLRYLAPEALADGPRALDARSDVYALGVILWESATLSLAPEVRSEAISLGQAVDSSRRFERALGCVSADLRAVISTALEHDPARRYAGAGELAADLRRLSGGERPRARREHAAQRALRWCRRHRVAAGVFLAVAFGLAGALAATLARAALAQRTRASAQLEADRWTAAALTQRAAADLHSLLPSAVEGYDKWLAECDGVLARTHGAERALPELAGLRMTAERVRERRGLAAALWERSIERHAAAWERAQVEIAASHLYAGLRIVPQLGLVPLGPDPRSGLQEFAHLLTGEPPSRDPSSAELTIGEATSAVLVLLPGGVFSMGARVPSHPGELGEANVDPLAVDLSQQPVHTVALAPFFISKYELTQGQWARVTGSNPSRWQPGSSELPRVTLAHPVANLSWDDASEVLARVGLSLPTEAQWEFGARGGTTTPWWTGGAVESLAVAENVADLSWLAAENERLGLGPAVDFDDGHALHAAVGSLAANPFGLHDVLGNVNELCRDTFSSYDEPVAAGDGLRLAPEGRQRVQRGGSFDLEPYFARCASRQFVDSSNRFFALGVRPARSLDGPWSR